MVLGLDPSTHGKGLDRVNGQTCMSLAPVGRGT